VDNKHRKLFVVEQLKGCKYMRKCTRIRLAAGKGRVLLRWERRGERGDGKGVGESPLQGFVGTWGGCRMNTVYQYSTREQVLGDGNTERAGLPGRSGYVVCLQVSHRPHVTFIFIYIHEATYAATTITGNLT